MPKIWEQITPLNWCKGAIAKGPNGSAVNDIKDGCSFCAIGWIEKVYPGENEYRDARLALRQAVSGPVSEWNDNPNTKFEEVKEAFKRADL